MFFPLQTAVPNTERYFAHVDRAIRFFFFIVTMYLQFGFTGRGDGFYTTFSVNWARSFGMRLPVLFVHVVNTVGDWVVVRNNGSQRRADK